MLVQQINFPSPFPSILSTQGIRNITILCFTLVMLWARCQRKKCVAYDGVTFWDPETFTLRISYGRNISKNCNITTVQCTYYYLCVSPWWVDVASVAAVWGVFATSCIWRLTQHGVQGVLVHKVPAGSVRGGDVVSGFGHRGTTAIIPTIFIT